MATVAMHHVRTLGQAMKRKVRQAVAEPLEERPARRVQKALCKRLSFLMAATGKAFTTVLAKRNGTPQPQRVGAQERFLYEDGSFSGGASPAFHPCFPSPRRCRLLHPGAPPCWAGWLTVGGLGPGSQGAAGGCPNRQDSWRAGVGWDRSRLGRAWLGTRTTAGSFAAGWIHHSWKVLCCCPRLAANIASFAAPLLPGGTSMHANRPHAFPTPRSPVCRQRCTRHDSLTPGDPLM